MTTFKEQHSLSPEEQIRKTEEAVANAGGATTIPKDTPRWSEAQTGEFSEPGSTSVGQPEALEKS